MIYTTGTIAVSGNTLTGTGTNFTAAGSLIRVGCTVIAMTSPPQVFQITGISNGTVMTVSPAASPALAAGTKYSILLSDSLSVDGLAQDIAETFAMYQRNISGFADVMNGTGDVTITVDGKAVTVPGQKSLAKKGANSDITSLTGLTTALSVEQGGTGSKTISDAKSKLEINRFRQQPAQTTIASGNGKYLLLINDSGALGIWDVEKNQSKPIDISNGGTGATTAAGIRQNAGLGTAAILDATESTGDTTTGRVMRTGDFGLGRIGTLGVITRNTSFLNSQSGVACGFFKQGGGADAIDFGGYGTGVSIPYGLITAGTSVATAHIYMMAGGELKTQWRIVNVSTGEVSGRIGTVYTTSNTTKSSDGTIKSASPIVKVFHDGRTETNDESEGCTVTRLAAGKYLIKNCIGMNADASWGGINGGFDIPCDRNGQELIWLDYEVNADGSILVETYHRTYPNSPVFARNDIEGLADGDPVDIPADQFVSVRVEMPQDSIWNLKMATIEAESEVLHPQNEIQSQEE